MSFAAECLHFVQFGFLLHLRRQYSRIGRWVGVRPCLLIVLCLIVTAISGTGLARLKLADRIKEGYTPLDAPSRYENEVYRQFTSTIGREPYKTVVLITSRDGGSVLRRTHFERIAQLSNHVTTNLSVTVDGELYRFANVCDHVCRINDIVQYFKRAIDGELKNTILDYPFSQVEGIPHNVAYFFYGVRHTTTQLTWNRIEHVSLMLLYLQITDLSRGAEKWEAALFDYIYHELDDDLIEVATMGDRMVINEMNKGGLSIILYFGAGFALMCLFIMTTVLISSYYHGQFKFSKIILAWAALISPLLACITTFGLICWMNIELYPMMLLAPYLIIAIGVDDAFLMLHSWHKVKVSAESASQRAATRLGLVLEDVGPSITITSLTNTLAFGIGATTTTPVIRLFCFITALAFAIDFIYELLFFGSILSLTARSEEKDEMRIASTKSSFHSNLVKTTRQFVVSYSNLLVQWPTVLVISILTVAFWVASIWGIQTIQTVVSIRKILPSQSPLRRADDFLEKYVWKEYYPMEYIVSHPPNISNSTEYDQFKTFIKQLEVTKFAMGSQFTNLWLNSYERAMDTSFLNIFGESPVISYDDVPVFLNEHKHFGNKIRYSRDNRSQIQVDQFIFETAFHHAITWEQRVEIMETSRALTANFSQFNISAHSTNGYICDAITNLKEVIQQTVVITLICMTLVCALFIPSVIGILCASWAIASTSLAVLGSLSWWGMDLDPVTMTSVLMSIGFSVDFTAHTSYHYQKAFIDAGGGVSKKERLVFTFNAVSWPMFQAGVSTICCVVPLALHGDYAPTIFVRTIYLLVSWGLIHGLLILPTLLAALPDCCMRHKFRNKSRTNGEHSNGAELEKLQNGIEK